MAINVNTILAAIASAARVAQLAIQVGEDATPFIQKIEEWAKGTSVPTQDAIDTLNAAEQPYLDALNDKSKDV